MSSADFWLAMPLDLLVDPDLNDSDRAVYLLLLSFCDFRTTDNCYPTTAQVAARGNRKDRSGVVRSIAKLIAKGWLTRTPRFTAQGQSGSLYKFPRHPVLNARGDGGCDAQKPQGVVRKSRTTLEVITQEPGTLSPISKEGATAPSSLTARTRPTKRDYLQAIHHIAVVQHLSNGGDVPDPIHPDDAWDF